MKFARVENDEVVEFSSKPKIANVSNPELLSNSELKEYGWYPVKHERVSLEPWEQRGPSDRVVQATQVKLVETKKDKGLERFKQEKISQLQKNAENTILGTGQYSAGIDPFLQEFDPRTAANEADIKSVVDDYKAKKAEIEAATTYQEVEDVYLPFTTFVPPEDLDENGHIILDEVV